MAARSDPQTAAREREAQIEHALKVLGLGAGATEAEIKARWRELARKYHPDTNRHPSALKRFQELQAAYATLQSQPAPAVDLGASAERLARDVGAFAESFVRDVGAYAVDKGSDHARDLLRTRVGGRGKVGELFNRFGQELIGVVGEGVQERLGRRR